MTVQPWGGRQRSAILDTPASPARVVRTPRYLGGMQRREHELRTPGLTLRPFLASDAEVLVSLDSDPEVMRWINGGRAVPRDEVLRTSLPRVLGATDASRGVGFWTAGISGTDRAIGWFHLKPPSVPAGCTGAEWGLLAGELEIGWRLERSAWNRGLASEGARELVRFAFESLRAPRVIACTMLGNAASRRVMEKTGMRYDGGFLEDRWPLEDKRAVRYVIHADRDLRPSGPEGADKAGPS